MGNIQLRLPRAGRSSSVQFLRVVNLLYCMIGLVALSSTGLAQVEPALPGSVEYWLTSNNYSWVRTSDAITVGSYVEDLLSGRWDQPVGRGEIGIVTAVGWDADYNTMAAMVDFWRGYSVGIVFPELSAVEIVPIPEPSSLSLLVVAGLLGCPVLGRSGRAKAKRR